MKKISKLPIRVLEVITEAKSPLPPIDIQNILGREMKVRSIRYAISVLEEHNLIRRQPDLKDIRSYFIYLKISIPTTNNVN